MFARFLLTVLFLLVPVAVLAPAVAAQGSDTIYDEAGVLSDPEEQQVQEAFDQTQEDSGQQLYAFLVPDTNVEGEAAQRELLEQEAREEDVPQDAGIIVVAPNDRWAQLANIDGTSEEAVYEAMVPDFQRVGFAAGLVAGAE
ncbi:MAG: TPM domain-containing protein, partial [Actinobacteria bacterium]|nr:TPM domain-containing protein [Actinomycetota bacterium]